MPPNGLNMSRRRSALVSFVGERSTPDPRDGFQHVTAAEAAPSARPVHRKGDWRGQVSWLAGRCPHSAFPGKPSGIEEEGSPLTVAGAAPGLVRHEQWRAAPDSLLAASDRETAHLHRGGVEGAGMALSIERRTIQNRCCNCVPVNPTRPASPATFPEAGEGSRSAGREQRTPSLPRRGRVVAEGDRVGCFDATATAARSRAQDRNCAARS